MPVTPWVKKLVEDTMGSAPFKIGDIVKHPDGRTVKIVSGRYWGRYGLSNHWGFSEVLKNGRISKKIEYGYGW